jgi:hypothetical protein
MASLPITNKSSSVPTHVIQPHSAEGAIGSVIALCFVIFLTITGNVAIIVIFRVYKRVRKQVTNHFLINLAISDLIVALVTMPFWLVWEIDRWRSVHRWIDQDTLDRIWTFVDIGKFYWSEKFYFKSVFIFFSLIFGAFSQLINKMCSHCLFPVVDKSGTSYYHLVTRLMRPTDSQQVVPTSLISSARNKLMTTSS